MSPAPQRHGLQRAGGIPGCGRRPAPARPRRRADGHPPGRTSSASTSRPGIGHPSGDGKARRVSQPRRSTARRPSLQEVADAPLSRLSPSALSRVDDVGSRTQLRHRRLRHTRPARSGAISECRADGRPSRSSDPTPGPPVVDVADRSRAHTAGICSWSSSKWALLDDRAGTRYGSAGFAGRTHWAGPADGILRSAVRSGASRRTSSVDRTPTAWRPMNATVWGCRPGAGQLAL